MLKLVQYINYDAPHTYAAQENEAVINTEEIISIIPIPRDAVRRPFDDVVRVRFHDGTWMDIFGKPSDFIEDWKRADR